MACTAMLLPPLGPDAHELPLLAFGVPSAVMTKLAGTSTSRQPSLEEPVLDAVSEKVVD